LREMDNPFYVEGGPEWIDVDVIDLKNFSQY
jgi:hypothetical protein